MTASQVVWEPDEKVASDTRMAAFMRHHGFVILPLCCAVPILNRNGTGVHHSIFSISVSLRHIPRYSICR